MIQTPATLTEIEALGLAGECNMADGHAYQDLTSSQQRIVQNLPAIWDVAKRKKHKQAEIDFRNAFSNLAHCPSLFEYSHFRICPTASNSIDTLATWLKENHLTTLLIEPTFDNLALILRRRGVQIEALPENELSNLTDTKPRLDFGALFLVKPNNPTGCYLSKPELTRIAKWCAYHDKILLLDNTFRFFMPQDYDMYKVLLDSGVTFISIEDTGKVWPTQDLKVSLLIFSADIAPGLHLIYEEIYLCISNFQLELVGEFLRDAKTQGLQASVWNEVALRRAAFRHTIAETWLEPHPDSVNSRISVEWINIKSGFGTDFEVMDQMAHHGLIVLPGRHFYWSEHGPTIPIDSLRFSLLKPKVQFLKGLQLLQQALQTKGFS